MRRGDDFSTSPTERMKRNYARRRWSDSPTLLRDVDLQPNRKLLITADHDLTQSLHDLSEPILQPVSKLSSISQNNLSTSTIQSGIGVRTKSQDSGFNKSASYLSLHSTSRKYSHVESKVKKYVQDIKDAEALRKKSLSNNSVNNFVPPSSTKEKKAIIENAGNVEEYIEKLQSDLEDKETLLRALQGSYDDLLLKHAEAENKIDQLRLRSLESPQAWRRRSNPSFPEGLDFQSFCSPGKNLLGSKLSCFTDTSKLSSPKEVLDSSCEFDGSFSPSVSESILLSPAPQSDQEKSDTKKVSSKEVVISAPLGPIQKLYSTSLRLDRVLQPLNNSSPKLDDSNSTPSFYENHSPPQGTAVVESQVEGKEASDEHSEDNGGTKSNMYYTTADTGMSNNLYHLTTDTGIEDCIQSATDKDTENEIRKTQGRLPIGSQLKRVPNFPNEDAFSKVQRWRDSLPSDITDRRVESAAKMKKTRNRKLALPRKSVGIQTTDQSKNTPCLCTEEPCLCDLTNSSALVKLADASDNYDYAESLGMTDCDNFSDISCRSAKKKSWSTNVMRTRKGQPLPRSKSVEPLNRHQCCGECKTCGSAITADARPRDYLSSSTSHFSPKRAKDPPQRKSRSGVDRAEKIRRDSPCLRKTVRCPRVAGAQVTRAVLLDMLLNVQSGHSCCCCCQHTWRGRHLTSPVPNEGAGQERVSENALQQCLAEIQKIAWDLNEKLAQSHAGLVNLSCRKKD